MNNVTPCRIEIYQTYGYLCIYVTAKKPNFPKLFLSDNGKNLNMGI